jgi:hypothetical protein
MAENLKDFMRELEGKEAPAFIAPQIYYGPKEDSLLFYFRNDESYAHRLDNVVTLFLSFEGDEVVGCQVKGLRRKLESDGRLSVVIRKDGKVKLGLFFHLLAFDVPEPEPRSLLVELGQQAKGIEVDPMELASSPC